MNEQLTHLDSAGKAQMVDVSGKPIQQRTAIATGKLLCQADTVLLLKDQALPKGDVLAVARVAGIQGAKRTSDLIPLCHPLPIHQASVDFHISDQRIEIFCMVVTDGKTGVEMEALTGVSVAALTLYDMLKAVDKTMQITDVLVAEKIKA